MKRIGKKGKEWIRDRAGLIKEAVILGRIEIVEGEVKGKCEDCGEWQTLDFDHIKKRSQGGSNDKSNISTICRRCHNLRDNMGDPKHKKITKRKPEWMSKHACHLCGFRSSQLLCPGCGRVSIKIYGK
jgi:5-methylcytosine-specific restriction endonuclease McrA